MTHPTPPRWALDLVRHLQRQEAADPTLYVHTDQGFVRSAWCPGEALAHVPPLYLEAARIADAYLADLGHHTDPATPTEPDTPHPGDAVTERLHVPDDHPIRLHRELR